MNGKGAAKTSHYTRPGQGQPRRRRWVTSNLARFSECDGFGQSMDVQGYDFPANIKLLEDERS